MAEGVARLQHPRGALAHRVRRTYQWAPRRATARARPLPDFLVLGAAKAGTTSLYAYLCEHPAVLPARQKEINFFGGHYADGPAWYRSHFPLGATRALRSARLGQRVVTGEATPSYLSNPTVPERVASLLPAARLLILLRDPVERAYSQYQHAVRLGAEDLSFEEAVAAEPARRAELIARHGEIEAENVPAFQFVSYMARSNYVDQVTRWLQRFERDQLLVLRSEDLRSDPRRTCAVAFEHIGVEPWDPPRDFAPLNAGRHGGLDEATRQQLAAHFDEPNRQLSALLGMEFAWVR